MTNDEPRPVLAGKVWPFLGFLLVLFLVYIGVRGIIAGVSPASPDPPTGTEEQADSSVKTQIQLRTKYTQCLKAKRMLVPVPIYSGDSDCRAQLETTQQALEA